ncbi:uncharacterized protein LOC115238751 [Formica exsecta]|uniref:uncharacterized protein LOC115238750 n=1 Tax=Formica exsecta TaxID=72781 RepID=UPI0011428325|nr:uncharacterized protein LOC115238750 [Formica exsecta]XP_029668658.1 uncharacterized protein LOC115238751 [Formica exsecta]
MKNRIVQSPAYEDSGVAISGELGEPSFSGECEGIVSLQAPKEIEEDANPDPRYAAQCTIRQHYYPENGWGWVIVVTGVMVQILATGIQGAAGAWLLLDGTKRYRQTLLNVGT